MLRSSELKKLLHMRVWHSPLQSSCLHGKWFA